MKYRFLILNFQFLILLLAGCTSGGAVLPDSPPDEVPDTGEGVTLTFDMYSATVTRGETTSAEDMTIGKLFRIYAYSAGETSLGTPLDSRNYTVQPDETDAAKPGKATGNLTLYRGTYDLYLVSYNSSTEVPTLNSDGSFTVNNGKDFMYTKLEGIVVQPDRTGSNAMLVSLPRPFTRMGSQVITTVKAKNGTQPVAVSKLTANWIKISGLAEALNYKLGNVAWEGNTNYTSSYTFERFTWGGTSTSTWTSEAQVLLPVDGSQMLNFEVNLTVDYDNDSQHYTGSYPASIQKVLLPGMTYQFDFTLTFYGVLSPSDLTLAIREYNTVDLSSDGLGGND